VLQYQYNQLPDTHVSEMNYDALSKLSRNTNIYSTNMKRSLKLLTHGVALHIVVVGGFVVVGVCWRSFVARWGGCGCGPSKLHYPNPITT